MTRRLSTVITFEMQPGRIFRYLAGSEGMAVIATAALFSVPGAVFASFGQMSICDQTFECAVMAAIVFAPAALPLALIVSLALYRKLHADCSLIRWLVTGAVISLASHLLAIISVTGIHEVIDIPTRQAGIFNVSAFLLSLLLYVLIGCAWAARRARSHRPGKASTVA